MDRNRQEWTEQTGKDRNRQEQTGYRKLLHLNYCILKKFIYQIGNLEVRNRQEQTGEKKTLAEKKKKAVSKTAQDRGQKLKLKIDKVQNILKIVKGLKENCEIYQICTISKFNIWETNRQKCKI